MKNENMLLKNRVEAEIQGLENRLQTLRVVYAFLLEPEPILGASAQGKVLKPPQKKNQQKQTEQQDQQDYPGTVYERLVFYFQNAGNEWATVKELVDAIGRSKASIRQAIYKHHVDKFERISKRGFGQESQFRLKVKQ